MAEPTASPTHYDLLNLHPSASQQQIRQTYRELSKLYHPDTTSLPAAIATAKFQQLNEAYATLSNPERRLTYDLKIGYSRYKVIQPPADLNRPTAAPTAAPYRSTDWSANWSANRYPAYRDPTDRPLSAGELFALFILGLTFLGCLGLAIGMGIARGEIVL
jgi:curved DNA-binding protein CbpA